MVQAGASSSRSDVGVPLAERVLTNALAKQAAHMAPPGSGRSLIHLQEVQLGVGRPDSIMLVASPRGLTSRRKSHLRLPSIAHARMLGASRANRSTGYSWGHERQLLGDLRDIGWLRRDGSVRDVPRLIDRSLVVEAKISDWRTGISQLARIRWAGHEAALLMPGETQHRVPRRALRHNRLGLYVLRNGAITQQVSGLRLDLAFAAELWLVELAVRHLEVTGSAAA